MKKLFIVAACAFCIFTATAQKTSSTSYLISSSGNDAQSVRFGIRGGLNWAILSGDFDNALGSRIAYHVGVITEIPLIYDFYMQTGFYFQSKGAVYKPYNVYPSRSKEAINALYLQIPILASYCYDISDVFQMQVNFGPYFAYGVGGKYKLEERQGKEYYGFELDVFGDKGILKNFDCGLQIGGGITFVRHYYLGLTYEFGLTNMAKAKDAEVKPKNRNWMLSLGYTF